MPFGPFAPAGAPLRNREPATPPATMTSVIDESLAVVSGSALDMSAWRMTATPAGSRGRITAVGDKLHEAGTPVRFHIRTMQFDPWFTVLPISHADMDAAALNLARQGYNAIRLMGVEHFVMSGQSGAGAAFNADYLDRFDYWVSACKAAGLFWVFTVISYNAFEDLGGMVSRFGYTDATNTKPRMYTEQNVRDNYRAGVAGLYNRVNRYTGLNMLQDPALVLFEFYNEQSTMFCAAKEWPSRWLTRTAGSSAAAKTWVEWLQDTSKAHGYANLAALNASWGTAHASYAAAAATPMAAQTNAMPKTQQNIDGILYCEHLDDDLAAYFSGLAVEWSLPCLVAAQCCFSAMVETRGAQKYSANNVANWHNYANISFGVSPGVATTNADVPIWESERVTLTAPIGSGAKPAWLGECGNHSYARWRHHFPIVSAASAAQGAVAMSWFDPTDPFTLAYSNDTTPHGDRVRRLDSFASGGAYAHDFVRIAQAAIFLRGDVSELPVAQTLILNARFFGVSPRNTGRMDRAHSTLFHPLQLMTLLVKLRLGWTDDTSDDSLAVPHNTKDWKTICLDAQTATAIAADHPTLVSVNANAASIVSVATTGTVGGLAASEAQPVLNIGSNSLVDGDLVLVTNITGSVGSWPGTNSRSSRAAVVKGTGNYVQLVADATRGVPGLQLTGLSGANFTAGTWCELANVIESGHREWGMSRRLKRAFVNTAKTVLFAHTNATLPATVGPVVVSALTQNASLFLTSLDGNSIATSSRLLLGLCGEAINTGMTYSVANGVQTLTATGDYPVQHLDATATLSLGVALPQAWTLYRLQRNGQRSSAESAASVDAGAARLVVTLRTGTVYPAVMWELVRP